MTVMMKGMMNVPELEEMLEFELEKARDFLLVALRVEMMDVEKQICTLLEMKLVQMLHLHTTHKTFYIHRQLFCPHHHHHSNIFLFGDCLLMDSHFDSTNYM